MEPVPSIVRAEAVVAEVDARRGATCAACSTELVGQEVVASWMTGHKAAPCCLTCLARDHGIPGEAFVERLRQMLLRLDCYRAGWVHAERLLRAAGSPLPDRVSLELGEETADEDEPDELEELGEGLDSLEPGELEPAETWDAGDMSCGDLVLELRLRLAERTAGELILVRATDPGAPEDIPAWCRVTGHPLVRTAPPLYWIRRRPDRPR